MSYWSNLAKKHNTKLSTVKETITLNSSPVQKSIREILWTNYLGEISFTYYHNEHALSHNNYTFSIISIKLNTNANLNFEFKKIDFLEKLFNKIWNSKKSKVLNNYLLKSNNFKKSKKIIKSPKNKSLLINSIELINIENESNLIIKTPEDFIRKKNAHEYINYALKLAESIHKNI